MPIPALETLMLPVLRLASDGAEHQISELRERVAKDLNLTPDELAEKLKNGLGVFVNRLNWAVAYLKKAKLVDRIDGSAYRITERGIALLEENLPEITVRILHRYPEIRQMYRGTAGPPEIPPVNGRESPQTPEEQLEKSLQDLQDALAEELLEAVKKSSPSAFERIVVNLLEAMGYGLGEVEGRSGDGGIDGKVKQDKLGLDVVYVQAKRWQDNVGSPEVREFCGALTLRHANKGVFITTSSFSKDARDLVTNTPQKLVLVDGKLLAQFMIEYGLGVTVQKTYALKRIDKDYFETI
jgi:restriction system protein